MLGFSRFARDDDQLRDGLRTAPNVRCLRSCTQSGGSAQPVAFTHAFLFAYKLEPTSTQYISGNELFSPTT
jgi:hypothetical protein